MLVILTKLGSPETVGVYGIAQAIALPISTFLTLRLRTVQVTDIGNEFEFGHYYALTLIMTVLTIVSVAVVGIVKEAGTMASIITLLGSVYAFANLRQVFIAMMQKTERMYLISISQAASGFLSLVLFSLFFYFSRDLCYSVTGYLLSQLIVLLLYDLPVVQRLHKSLEKRYKQYPKLTAKWHLSPMRALVKKSLPLGFVALLGSLLTSIPRLVMDKYVSREVVGYYVGISSILVFGNMLTVAIGQAVSPRLARYYQESIKSYRTLMVKFTVVCLVIGLAGVVISFLAGRIILNFMFTQQYAEYSRLLTYVMIAGVFLFLFSSMNTALNTARCFMVQVPVYGLVVVVCLGGSFLLIPVYGIYGAAIAVCLANFVGFVVVLFLVLHAISKKTALLTDKTPD
jgi:O-antigen/teichoic acid export membrane protein